MPSEPRGRHLAQVHEEGPEAWENQASSCTRFRSFPGSTAHFFGTEGTRLGLRNMAHAPPRILGFSRSTSLPTPSPSFQQSWKWIRGLPPGSSLPNLSGQHRLTGVPRGVSSKRAREQWAEKRKSPAKSVTCCGLNGAPPQIKP